MWVTHGPYISSAAWGMTLQQPVKAPQSIFLCHNPCCINILCKRMPLFQAQPSLFSFRTCLKIFNSWTDKLLLEKLCVWGMTWRKHAWWVMRGLKHILFSSTPPPPPNASSIQNSLRLSGGFWSPSAFQLMVVCVYLLQHFWGGNEAANVPCPGGNPSARIFPIHQLLLLSSLHSFFSLSCLWSRFHFPNIPAVFSLSLSLFQIRNVDFWEAWEAKKVPPLYAKP